MRPVASDDVPRRIICVIFCRIDGRVLSILWAIRVVVSGGVDTITLIARLGFKEGCTILSYDELNIFKGL